jgi:hypothetical protein
LNGGQHDEEAEGSHVSEEMMACPFCGADGDEIKMIEIDFGQQAVTCNCCTAIGPSDALNDRAVMLWNGSALKALGRTRAAFERAVTVTRCGVAR